MDSLRSLREMLELRTKTMLIVAILCLLLQCISMVYISANKEDLMDDISLLTMYANTKEEIDDRRSSRRSSTIRPLVVGIAGGSG